MNRAQKETAVKNIAERIKQAKALLLADYRGLNVRQMTELRGRLRQAKSSMRVVRNRLAKMAFKALSIEGFEDHLKGPTLFVSSDADPVEQAKVLVNYARENGNLKLKAGLMDGRILAISQIRALAILPSREVLLAMFLSALNAPAGNLVGVLSAVPRKLVGVLDAIGKLKHE